jgi:hypothetical protein
MRALLYIAAWRAALPLQRRQQCPSPRRKLLIDGVQHEAYPEVITHDRHDLDRVLAPEMAHHPVPKFTADSMVAKKRAPESDERGVLVGQSLHVPVVLDDINDRLFQALPHSRRFVPGPFVLLVDFSCGNENRQLKVSSADRTILT